MNPPLDAITPDWPLISRLLDEALDLPSEQRHGWLEAQQQLPPHVRATLARLLAAPVRAADGEFLQTLPTVIMAPGAAGAGADTELRADAVVGPWRLLREIGEGGMGSVWLAERSDGQLKRQVALKLPRISWARGLAERMARERDILATLEHPHIARLYDAGLDAAGRPWLALEFVPGRAIDQHCRDKSLPLRQRVELLLQVCEAVAYAHSRLVIHRDLKPGNVLVTDDGRVKLLDFGIAKLLRGDTAESTELTRVQGRALTLDYASPEQVRGEALTTASDVYSLGVVAYELLTGSRPYRMPRGVVADLAQAIEAAEAAPASRAAGRPEDAKALRGDLDAILHKALKKKVAERYASVDALAQDLRRWLRQEPVSARPDAWGYRASRWVLRHRVETGVAGAVLLALVGGAFAQVAVLLALALGATAAVWQARSSRAQAQRAESVQAFLVGIFESAAATQADGAAARAKTLQTLLKDSADRLLADDRTPADVRLDLCKTLGVITRDLDMVAQAVALLDARIRLLRELRRPIREQVDAGIDRYWALHRARRMDDAEAQLRSTLEDARSLSGAEGERRAAQVLGILARQLADTSGFLRGREELALAVQGLSRHDPDGPDLIDAQVLQAQFRVRSGDEDGGLEALAAAVARFERHPEANLVNLDFFRSQLSRGYLQCERFAAALPLLQQGFEASLRSAGPGSLHAVIWQRSVAMAQFGDNQVEAAVETLQAMRQAAQGNESPAVAAYEGAALHQLAQIEFAAGRFEAAMALIAESLEVLRRTNPRGVILRSAQRSAAAMHIALGQGAAAERELDGIDHEHAAQGTQASDDAAKARLERAWLQLLHGQFDAVEAAIEVELAAPEPPHFGRIGVHRVARALQARCLAWRGNVGGAMGAFDALLAELDRADATRSARRLVMDLKLVLGSLLLDHDAPRAARLATEAWQALQADRLQDSELGTLASALCTAAGAPLKPEGPVPSPLLAEHLVNPRFRPPGGR